MQELNLKILALDVGGTALKSALVESSNIQKSNEFLSNGKLGGEFVLSNIFKAIEMYDDYDVIGISTTGQVNSEEGYIIYANENVPNYTGMRLKDIITQKYHKPVFIENDVNAAAIGEGFFGAAKAEKDFLCLTYGTGIGGAIVLNKEVYKGISGVAGEVGHILTHPNGLSCGCGQKGCYEQYASVTALVREAMAINPSLTNGKLIFQSLANGDTATKKIVDNWIDEIIYGLVTLIHTFNPSCIVLGGGIMKEVYIIDQINAKIQTKIMSSYSKVKIIPAQLGNNAGVFGMVSIAQNAVQK